jgi:flagellar basal-body rod protein FlgG
MSLGIYSSYSGMAVNQTRFDTAAHNLANINTSGFRAQSVAVVESRVAVNPGNANSGAGAATAGTMLKVAQGALKRTDIPSDAAVNGRGFFRVQRGGGETFFTRAGEFTRDGDGFLRTPTGEALMGSAGPVKLPAGTQSFSLGRDGKVTAFNAAGDASVVDTVTLALFGNEQGLEPRGSNLLAATAGSGPPVLTQPGTNGAGTLEAGALEVSNTDFASEVVTMISAQRSFEANAATMRTADAMLKTLTRSLS